MNEQNTEGASGKLRASDEWRTVERDGLPPCDGETVFVGINTAGYCACFNEVSQYRHEGKVIGGTSCFMNTAEESEPMMGELEWWRVLDIPAWNRRATEGASGDGVDASVGGRQQ